LQARHCRSRAYEGLCAPGGGSALCATFLLTLYRLARGDQSRSLLRRIVLRLERGPMYSLTIREIFRRFHGVEAGLYTYGPCEVSPGHHAPGTVFGRYSSIYWSSRVMPAESTGLESVLGGGGPHPTRSFEPGAPSASKGVEIGSDVFMGHHSCIMPSAATIGHGAIIGAGSIVRTPIPPYAIVTGNPARVVRYRFSEAKIQELLEKQWWTRSIGELAGNIEEFRKPLEGGQLR
jgi:virginiamycin A acetyltransferase